MNFESPPEMNHDFDPNRHEVIASLERAGFSENLSPEVIDRLVLLEQESEFNRDSRMIEVGMKNLAEFIDDHPEIGDKYDFTEDELREGQIAAVLHDIGKAGPAEASFEQQRAVVRLFAAPEIESPKQTVESALRSNYPDDADEMLQALAACDVSPTDTMRSFWDKHAYWTKDVLEAHPEGTTERMRVIAASHHIDKDIDPYNLDDDKARFQSEAIGGMEYYVEAAFGRMLMAIDKVQASVRRSNRSHEEAMEFTKQILGDAYKDDPMMLEVLGAIDELGREGALFDEERAYSQKK